MKLQAYLTRACKNVIGWLQWIQRNWRAPSRVRIVALASLCHIIISLVEIAIVDWDTKRLGVHGEISPSSGERPDTSSGKFRASKSDVWYRLPLVPPANLRVFQTKGTIRTSPPRGEWRTTRIRDRTRDTSLVFPIFRNIELRETTCNAKRSRILIRRARFVVQISIDNFARVSSNFLDLLVHLIFKARIISVSKSTGAHP